MQLEDVIHGLIRPRILLQAAKISLKTYSRNRDLKRLFKTSVLPQAGHAVERLMRREHMLEQARLCGNAAYDLKLHIQVMAALLQELHMLPKKCGKP